MELRFSNFRFLPESLVLYQDDELIPLKQNQALLLRFFLRDPEKIHSKDEIMDSVWQDKVVSEQVVFQTISQLRAVLGDSAIRTFSKKGYQWQLALQSPLPVELLADNDAKAELQESNHCTTQNLIPANRKVYLLYVSAVAIVVIILFIAFYQGEPQENKVTLFIPATLATENQPNQEFKRSLMASLATEQTFSSHTVKLKGSVQQFFSSPKHSWLQANLTSKQWLLFGEVLDSDKGVFYHYRLTNGKLTWQGYVFSKTITDLPQKLLQRLHTLYSLGVFLAEVDELPLAKLLAMHKVRPNDAEITLLLAKYYSNVNQSDAALVYLDKLVTLSSEYNQLPYQATAYYQIGKIYKHRGRYALAHYNFDLMAALVEPSVLLHFRLDVIHAKAWLAYAEGDSQRMFSVLDNGLSLLKDTSDPLSVFELHILYSILADKTGNHDKKYNHLNEAQALLLQYKLDESNLALVYYHFALFIKDNIKAIPYLHKILALPRTANNYWVQDQAFELLVQNFIDAGDYHLAHELFAARLTSPVKMLLQAQVYLAQQQNNLALPLLNEAFAVARLEHDVYTGLRAALALYRLTKHDAYLRARYWAYLQENAERNWLLQHDVITASE